jgi:hypothetical protein
MENQSKVIMIERNKFASLVKAHRKCLQMLSILAYACATKEVQLTFTLEEICELLQISREEVESYLPFEEGSEADEEPDSLDRDRR